ncbi:MAG: hypothetical protein WC197_09735 [Candidatus Gastranaerophilaceae bacterium]|jgi:hypothetical protein
MQVVSVDELVNHKILPYNLFNESGDKIMAAGEVLTPGKLLQLRYLSVIFTDIDEETSLKEEDFEDEDIQAVLSEPEKIDEEKPVKVDRTLDKQDKLVNKKSEIPPHSQVKMKTLYNDALKSVNEKANKQSVELFNEIRNNVLQDILPIIDKIQHKSQLKMIGDYDVYHGLNVAI